MVLPRKWRDEEVIDIINQYSNGVARLRIAKQYGTKPGSIRTILENNGVEIYPYYKFKLSPQQQADAVRRYISGERMSVLQDEYGVTVNTIKKLVRRRGHAEALRTCGGRYREFTPAEIAEMATMWRAGLSQTAIGLKFGAGQTTISKVLNKAGYIVVARKPVGEKHGSWKGGRALNGEGYVLIRTGPSHPYAAMATRSGYVPEHRLVMADHLGRVLSRSETVHHINGNITDNRIENLQLRQGKHGKGIVARCLDCGSHNIESVKLR